MGRIRYYILFRFAREIIISMRSLRTLMKFPILIANLTRLEVFEIGEYHLGNIYQLSCELAWNIA